MTKILVEAGQTYRAKAARGHRYVVIDQVRRPKGEAPYVLAHEVLPGGKAATGYLHGVPRGVQMKIVLWLSASTAPRMPPGYEIHTTAE